MRLLGFVLALSAFEVGCGSPVSSTAGMFSVPDRLDALAGEHFFDQPWPSDLRLEDGFVRFDGFPNPRELPILDEYVGAMKGVLDGFSPVAAGFLRFSGPIDPATLPATAADALDPNASVQLLDIDASSPEHGSRKLVNLAWRADATVYGPANTLAFLPTFGFPLRVRTRYALVVTKSLLDADGAPVAASAELRQTLGIDEPTRATAGARDRLATAVDEIEAAGVRRSEIAHLAVFTTNDPTAELFAIADATKTSFPAPTADAKKWTRADVDPELAGVGDEYLGEYGPSPNYQQGKIPYAQYGDGGGFEFKSGAPRVADKFSLRFSLTVPKPSACPLPAAGYPIVLYAHGTGGDYRSYVREGVAAKLAKHCVASTGVDQIFHGTRPGAPANGSEGTIELLFFNFQNVIAARTNTRQSAIDEVQRARLFTESHTTIPASVAKTGAEIKLDASKLLFFGHSQGGLNGPLFLAADDAARGGVLSGSSALITITLLEKTQPSPSIAGLVATVFLGLHDDELGEVDPFHPAIALAQTIVDVVDPIHYARFSVAEPRPGFSPKSIYMTEGVNADGTGDHYAPPHGIEAHALALGLPLQLPAEHSIVESAFGGAQPISVPSEGVSGDLASGRASGVLAQWAVPPGDDGHFVVFDVPQAREQAAQFCENLGDDPRGRVPAP